MIVLFATPKKINDDAKDIFFLLWQEELIHLKTIPNSLAVFCLATYGEGDPTDNAMEFIDWLKNGDAELTGLNYAVSILCSPDHFRIDHIAS